MSGVPTNVPKLPLGRPLLRSSSDSTQGKSRAQKEPGATKPSFDRLSDAQTARAGERRHPAALEPSSTLVRDVRLALMIFNLPVDRAHAVACTLHTLQKVLNLTPGEMGGLLKDCDAMRCLARPGIELTLDALGRLALPPSLELLVALAPQNAAIAEALAAECPSRHLFSFCQHMLGARTKTDWKPENIALLPKNLVTYALARAAAKAVELNARGLLAELRELCAGACPEHLHLVPPMNANADAETIIVMDGANNLKVKLNVPIEGTQWLTTIFTFLGDKPADPLCVRVLFETLQRSARLKVALDKDQVSAATELVKRMMEETRLAQAPNALVKLLHCGKLLGLQVEDGGWFRDAVRGQLAAAGEKIATLGEGTSWAFAVELLELSARLMDLLKFTPEQRVEWARSLLPLLQEIRPELLEQVPPEDWERVGLGVRSEIGTLFEDYPGLLNDGLLKERHMKLVRPHAWPDLQADEFITLALSLPLKPGHVVNLCVLAASRGLIDKFPRLGDRQIREKAAGRLFEMVAAEKNSTRTSTARGNSESGKFGPAEVAPMLLDLGLVDVSTVESAVGSALALVTHLVGGGHEPWVDAYRAELVARIGMQHEAQLIPFMLEQHLSLDAGFFTNLGRSTSLDAAASLLVIEGLLESAEPALSPKEHAAVASLLRGMQERAGLDGEMAGRIEAIVKRLT